jgi:membrane associated rhomboid family serine protease
MEINLMDYVEYNSVVTLSMFFISFFVLILDKIFGGFLTKHVFSTQRSSLLNPLTYIRAFTHVLGHADLGHFIRNYMKILLLGPLIEEKYGSMLFLIMILITALITAIVNALFRKDARLLDASGVTFMLITLSAFASISGTKIPLTLILVFIFYLADEVINIAEEDGIAHYGHVVGGICGIAFGILSINQPLVDRIINYLPNWL